MSDRSYISGVLAGDGWLTQRTIGLRAADQGFVVAFAEAITRECRIEREPRQDERGYWLYRTSNKTGRFNLLRESECVTTEEKAAWLRGLFDSEGNAQLTRSNNSPNSFGRRVAIFSTNIKTLRTAYAYFADLGIDCSIKLVKSTPGHKGPRPVYWLILRGSRANYQLFQRLVGSNIERKRITLVNIVNSYQPDLSYCSRGGQRSCESKWINKTHCIHGHLLPERDPEKKRRCLECSRRWVKEHRARRRNPCA